MCGPSTAEIILWSVYKINIRIYSSYFCGFTCDIFEVQICLCSPKFSHNYVIVKLLWGKTFKWAKEWYIIGCGCLWISSTLSQQVVPMVLHVEVYLIPPRGLPTIGPPKSCRPTQRLTLHSFFCKFCVPQNDCQVCVIRSTTMSVAPEMTDWNASLNWSDWPVRWP